MAGMPAKEGGRSCNGRRRVPIARRAQEYRIVYNSWRIDSSRAQAQENGSFCYGSRRINGSRRDDDCRNRTGEPAGQSSELDPSCRSPLRVLLRVWGLVEGIVYRWRGRTGLTHEAGVVMAAGDRKKKTSWKRTLEPARGTQSLRSTAVDEDVAAYNQSQTTRFCDGCGVRVRWLFPRRFVFRPSHLSFLLLLDGWGLVGYKVHA